MSRGRIIALGCAILAAVVSSSAVAHEVKQTDMWSAPLDPSASEAAKVVDAFHAALERGDTAAAAALLADDVLIFESGGAERTKAEYLAQHLAADMQFAQSTKTVTTRRGGRGYGSAAWIASEGRTTGTFRGKPINSVTTETMVLAKREDRWKIAHIHWSSAAAR